MKRKAWKKLLTMVTAAGIAAGMSTGAVLAGETEPIRIGTASSQVLPVIALQNGYFEEEGVEVEIVSFDGGPAQVEAFTSGELDIINIGDLPFFNAIINGVDVQAIGFYKSSVRDVLLLTAGDSGISSFEDLKGKRVSVPFGTNAQPVLYEFLEAGGLTADDVEILNLSAADGANALVLGDVDAAITWDPYSAIAVESGSEELSDTSDFRQLVCPIVAGSELIETKQEEIQAVLNAYEKAVTFAEENTEEAAALVAEYYGIESGDAYVVSINNSDLSIPLTEEKVEDLKKGAESCYKFDVIEENVDVEAHVNWTFAE